MEDVRNIENRPEELRGIPFYGGLPKLPVAIDTSTIQGNFLELDLLTLEGIQPIEKSHAIVSHGLISINPSEQLIELYREAETQFQLVHVVVNCYQFTDADEYLIAKPYNISLQPASKRGLVETVGIDWIEKADIEKLMETPQLYRGFNPFVGAYGLYMMGFADGSNIESDMLGFVSGMYFLATSFNHSEILTPGIGGIQNHPQASKDYRRFRRERYFKPFRKVKPRKIWGCDSPIELFLLQGMSTLGLNPELQTIICEDGLIVPHLHTLWENQKSRRKMKVITEADFFFPDHNLAVFCDSIAHHSSPEAIEKDRKIDEKLNALGIESLRISGPDIAQSPFKCATVVASTLEKIA